MEIRAWPDLAFKNSRCVFTPVTVDGVDGLHKALRDNVEARGVIEKEGAVLGSLPHPRIPKLLSQETVVSGRSGFIMEIIPGILLTRSEELYSDDKLLMRMVFQMLEVLAYVHGTGRIHADIKPNNIILKEEKEFFLIDFGSSRAIDLSVELSGLPNFAPKNGLANEYFDLYCLACTMMFFRLSPLFWDTRGAKERTKGLEGIFAPFLSEIILTDNHPFLKDVTSFRNAFVQYLDEQKVDYR